MWQEAPLLLKDWAEDALSPWRELAQITLTSGTVGRLGAHVTGSSLIGNRCADGSSPEAGSPEEDFTTSVLQMSFKHCLCTFMCVFPGSLLIARRPSDAKQTHCFLVFCSR